MRHSPADALAAAPGEGDPAMFCTDCGTRNPADANFCKQCGRKMERSGTPRLTEEEFALPVPAEDRVGELMVRAFKLKEEGDLEGAVAACRSALELRPESASAHSLLGMLYEVQGSRDLAIAEFEKVLQLNPGSIADREKLDALRDPTRVVKRVKITSSRRPVHVAVLSTPAGAAVAALGVFLLVLMGGAFVVFANGGRHVPASAPDVRTGAPQPAPAAQPQMAQSLPSPAAQPHTAAPQAAAAPPPTALDTRGPVAAPARPERTPENVIPPAAVQVAPLESERRPERQAEPARPAERTIHLPDNGLAPSEVGPPPAAAQPSPPPGKIEIVVSQNPGASPAAGGGSGRTAAATSQPPHMDSRVRQTAGLQAQMRGDYRTAVREYLKALDGAGDQSALIHERIALCYQRLDDRESAITHYNDALALYRQQAESGRNVEAANRAIRACETALKALQ